MAETYDITPVGCLEFRSKHRTDYFAARNTERASIRGIDEGLSAIGARTGQQRKEPWVNQEWYDDPWEGYEHEGYYEVMRALFLFDLDSLPKNRTISAAVLTLPTWASGVWHEDDTFDLVVVEIDTDALYLSIDPTGLEDPRIQDLISREDWANFQDTSLGSTSIYMYDGDDIVNDPNFDTVQQYQITLNSDALNLIRQKYKRRTKLWLGLRSSKDISATPPVARTLPTEVEEIGLEARNYVSLAGWGSCYLTITIPEWPEHEYPFTPEFPETGYMDSDTYAVIKSYIEELTFAVGNITSGNKNIYFAEYNKVIRWDGTDEYILRDEIAEEFIFSSMHSDSTITSCENAYIQYLTNTTLNVSGNASINQDLNINSTGYASIKEKIEHDNLWWEATGSTPSVAATKAKIYQELSSGDLKITINSGGQTKTAILADFSAL